MAEIRLLDNHTIDKIAAGEVVERPASVVKELVENAMDAGANAITVEIRDGGCSFIRVTDNGGGIDKDQIRKAFCRHATSKIRTAEDLFHISSLGFRGEALSSIAAVSLVELITKTKEQLTGVHYRLEGEQEKEFTEVGAPDGTTLIVRELFFNTPARKKFLKSPATEGSYISELMEHMALSRPDVSFVFMMNGKVRFHTSGSGDLKEIIYRIYGREVTRELIPFSAKKDGLTLQGFLGSPSVVRANRNFEFFFVNGRYIRSPLLSKGLEAGYRAYLMQHRFPFALLHIRIRPEEIDVNVHPSKMEVRFHDQPGLYAFLEEQVRRAMKMREMIPDVGLPSGEVQKMPSSAPLNDSKVGTAKSVRKPENKPEAGPENKPEAKPETKPKAKPSADPAQTLPQPFETGRRMLLKDEGAVYDVEKGRQMELFEGQMAAKGDKDNKEAGPRLLSEEAVRSYKILGQVFDTFWIAEYEDRLLFIDQHAAHEKVKYEALVKRIREGRMDSQLLAPPLVLNLSAKEANVWRQYRGYFDKMGFETEDFGGNAVTIRAVPCELFGHYEKEYFQTLLDELEEEPPAGTPVIVEEKLASMACRSAVKGNTRMSVKEMEELLKELLTLDNPYHCPHGRPTIITMSRHELEKKFKRIV